MFTMNACLGLMYSTTEETLSGFVLVLIDLTITVAAAVPRMLSAVPTIVWSALKLMQATPSREE